MNNNDRQFLIQKIRTQYTEKEHTQLDELKELDSKVKRPANVFSYLLGSVSAIIMGAGMSLVMTELAAELGIAASLGLPLGIGFGTVGGVLAGFAYPAYLWVAARERRRIAPEILRLTDELMK